MLFHLISISVILAPIQSYLVSVYSIALQDVYKLVCIPKLYSAS